MKNNSRFKTALKGFTATITRYPAAILLFFISAAVASYNIDTNEIDNLPEVLFSLALGATVSLVLQMVYERCCSGNAIRTVFIIVSIISSIIYYLVVEYAVDSFGGEHALRTVVLLFILLISFIWVPAIRSRIGLSESFMVLFKAFFIVLLYSGVLYLGICLVFMATDMLITNVDSEVYAHTAVYIAYVYAPIHLLSLVPVYFRASGEQAADQDADKDIVPEEDAGGDGHLNQLNKAIKPSKFLEGLVSYIIIPVTAAFTVILLLYIIMNTTGDFWKDNLMEPLLVSYSITVIVVYLLASVIRNKITGYFRIIFPKVLVPVVLFQTISSVLKIGELGVTSGRYYVIVFGIFATISAVIFSIRPDRKTNIIAPILIILSLISIIPPVDAFTISRKNQVSRLENILEKNNMLVDGRIVPNADIPSEDKNVIVSSVRYLSSMDYLKDISWMKEYNTTYDFERTFGFPQYGYDSGYKPADMWRLYLPDRTPVDISGFDYIVEVDLYSEGKGGPNEAIPLGNGYNIEHEPDEGIGDIVVKDNSGNEIIRYSLDEIFDRAREREANTFGELSMEEARYVTENDSAVLGIVVKVLHLEEMGESDFQNIAGYVMVKIK